ncbi:5312_t:CDS:2 [Funneliformis caledonium]|uniref:5312_t:CDS:1 n=1 Tax=Funneliformis caledonium TaxID=1117310 RepID=A0A9N9BEC0_9GLOM|nr:5312_t:CDS:2 [Funneliformis caledonium]
MSSYNKTSLGANKKITIHPGEDKNAYYMFIVEVSMWWLMNLVGQTGRFMEIL